MTTTHDDITREVRQAISDATERGPARTDDIQNAIVAAHIAVGDLSSDWSLCCAHTAVRFAIREVLREMKQREDAVEADAQMTMVGFERLQVQYLVERDGCSAVVRVTDMTAEELRSKAREHRKAGLGHFKHADELERYAVEREAVRPHA